MNPYADRIVPDPETRPAVSVETYNRENLDALIERVTRAVEGRHNATQANVLVSANPGSGKTHLLSRFIEEMLPLSLPIFIPPIHDRLGLARGVLSRVVARLWRMADNGRSVNQFEWLVLQLLGLGCERDAATAESWRAFPVEQLHEPFFQEYLRESRATLEAFLCGSFDELLGHSLRESRLAWSKALLDILSDDQQTEARAVEWVKGRLDAYPGLLGSDAGDGDAGFSDPGDDVMRAENRLFDLERLFGLCRPLIFVFDQVENFRAFGHESLLSFMVLVERLLVECPATQVVIAANAADWAEFVNASGLPESHGDRFHAALPMRGLTLSEAVSLRDLRAGESQVAAARDRIPDDWIRHLLRIGPDGRAGVEISPRRFLAECAALWDAGAEAGLDLEAEFEKAKALAEREGLAFDADSVMTFLVEVIGAQRVTAYGFEFARMGEHLVFAEGGSTWSRWEAWAKRASQLTASPADLCALRASAALCAREHLAFVPIPGPRWKRCHVFSDLLKHGMRIEEIDCDAMLEIAGACRLLDSAGDLAMTRYDLARWVDATIGGGWREFFSVPAAPSRDRGRAPALLAGRGESVLAGVPSNGIR